MNKQSGFGLVESLLIVLILAVVGFGGYAVWHNSKKTDPNAALGVTDYMTCQSHHGKVTQATPHNTCALNGKTYTATQVPVDTGVASGSTSQATAEYVSTLTYSKVEPALRTAILTELKKDVPGCVNSKDQIVNEVDGSVLDPDVVYDTLGFAKTGIGCGEGSAGLFAKVSGSWKFVASTQFGFDCSTLKQYSFTKKFIDAATPDGTCLDSSGNEVQYNG